MTSSQRLQISSEFISLSNFQHLLHLEPFAFFTSTAISFMSSTLNPDEEFPLSIKVAEEVIKKYNINPEKPSPITL